MLTNYNRKESLKRPPTVSVITVTKNSERYLKDTIESVVSQTYPNIEYLIIDGQSNDATLDIVKRYRASIDYWSSEPDKNMYEAINKGIARSTGDIISVLNSDDRYADEGVIARIVKLFMTGSFDGIYGDILVDYGSRTRYKRVFQVTFDQYLMSGKGTFVPHISLFMKRQAIEQLGGYNDMYNYASDYDFILRALKKYSLTYIPIPISIFRRHDGSITASAKIAAERDQVLLNNGFYNYPVIHRRLVYARMWMKYYFRNMVHQIRSVITSQLYAGH